MSAGYGLKFGRSSGGRLFTMSIGTSWPMSATPVSVTSWSPLLRNVARIVPVCSARKTFCASCSLRSSVSVTASDIGFPSDVADSASAWNRPSPPGLS